LFGGLGAARAAAFEFAAPDKILVRMQNLDPISVKMT
jgi:hypothetical protein